jgi:cytochrome-b5 reductase
MRGRATGDKTEVDLIFANVTPQDILLKEDLVQLAKDDAGIRVHYVLDKPPEGWTGGVGYVTADMITVSCSRYLPWTRILAAWFIIRQNTTVCRDYVSADLKRAEMAPKAGR